LGCQTNLIRQRPPFCGGPGRLVRRIRRGKDELRLDDSAGARQSADDGQHENAGAGEEARNIHHHRVDWPGANDNRLIVFSSCALSWSPSWLGCCSSCDERSGPRDEGRRRGVDGATDDESRPRCRPFLVRLSPRHISLRQVTMNVNSSRPYGCLKASRIQQELFAHEALRSKWGRLCLRHGRTRGNCTVFELT